MISHSSASAAALTLPLRTPRPTQRTPLAPIDTGLRFTTDGSAEMEAHLTRTCEKIAAGIRGLIPSSKLEAILLGGGYGRGEGGVLTTPAGDRPYNDLEFYVYLRGNRHLNERRYGRALHVLGEILTPQAGVEVEFKIASLAEFARTPISMFSYDLMLGHRWLVGRAALLSGCAHHCDAGQIPISEATRLLMNRCSGLLLAREKLARKEFTANDADFVRRNIAKAELALGDAVLVAYGQYHWSVHERRRRLERLDRFESMPWLDGVAQAHERGVEFKLYPFRSVETREALSATHNAITALAREVWFWIEARRLRTVFDSPLAYANNPANACPDTSPLRNLLLTLRSLGLKSLFTGRATRHPRERVLRALTLLLWEPTLFTSPEQVSAVQRELLTDGNTFSTVMPAYRRLWAQAQ